MNKRLIDKPSSRYFYPWPIVLVSTVDADGKPNIITIGASSICSSGPPVIGVAVGVRQYSLELMNRTGDFGVNLPTAQQLHETDYCGTHSGRAMDKYQAAGFTPQPATRIQSPLVLECPLSFECQIVHTAHLGSHDWVMGEVVAVHVAESLLDESGGMDLARTDPLLSFWGEYWSVGDKVGDWGYTRGE